MTIDEYLKTTVVALEAAGVESARLDALILLEDGLRQDRAILLAYPEQEIPAPLAAELYKKRTQREQHIPLAYIRGHAPFYGREFAVNEHVLVPRPESEAMIELLKKLTPVQATGLHIADIGTGSGALGITAALELSGEHHAHLFDISPEALVVAEQNILRHRLQAVCRRSDLLEHAGSLKLDVILANLPYVPEHISLNQAARHEPALAIFSGPDGLDHYKRFWTQVDALAHKPKLIITESLPSQHHTNALLGRAAGYFLEEHQGFAQAFRPMR